MDGVVLLDLPARDGRAWSLNPWKTRLILNYKGISYTTEWVEYPDVAPKGKSLYQLADDGVPLPTTSKSGVTPNTTEFTDYSIPMILLPGADGPEAHMNSALIAPILEKRYPEPSLHLDSPVVVKIADLLPKAMPKLMPILAALIPRNLLNPVSAEYFERKRSERYGMPLSELEKTKGGELAWQAADAQLKEIAAVVKEDPSGPFCLGKTVSYADFYIVSAMHFCKRVDPQVFDRFVKVDPAFGELYDALKPWLENDQ